MDSPPTVPFPGTYSPGKTFKPDISNFKPTTCSGSHRHYNLRSMTGQFFIPHSSYFDSKSLVLLPGFPKDGENKVVIPLRSEPHCFYLFPAQKDYTISEQDIRFWGGKMFVMLRCDRLDKDFLKLLDKIRKAAIESVIKTKPTILPITSVYSLAPLHKLMLVDGAIKPVIMVEMMPRGRCVEKFNCNTCDHVVKQYDLILEFDKIEIINGLSTLEAHIHPRLFQINMQQE